MVPQERHKQVARPILENEAKRHVAAAFKKSFAQFTNTQAAMYMRPAEDLGQFTQGKQALHALVLGQIPQALQYA